MEETLLGREVLVVALEMFEEELVVAWLNDDERVDSELIELRESSVLIVRLSINCGRPLVSGAVMLMTLMPWPSLLLAGINSVVEPSRRFTLVLSGWKSEQQSLASADVEYQWSASARVS